MYGTEETQPDTIAPVHAGLVAAIAQFLKPKRYVELGCSFGTTYVRVLPFVEDATAVDIAAVGPVFEQNGWPGFVQGDTVEYLETLPDESIDMVFLDSSHRYDATLKEFAVLDRKVRANGVVCFHDSHPPNHEFTQDGNCGKVYQAVGQLKGEYGGRWEFCTLPAQFGVTIARKNLGKQVLWQ